MEPMHMGLLHMGNLTSLQRILHMCELIEHYCFMQLTKYVDTVNISDLLHQHS